MSGIITVASGIIALVIAFATIVAYWIAKQHSRPYPQPQSRSHALDVIYGILVTGKRIGMARLAVEQFMQQTYPYKRLLIVQHGSSRVLTQPLDNVLEVQVDKAKNNLTLGDLRNIALNWVPDGSPWITWDDDDIRHPSLLQTMHRSMLEHAADVVSISNRYEYNHLTGLVWITQLKSGTVHSLVRADPRIRFLPKDSMEDVHLKGLYATLGKHHYVLQSNAPSLYIRIIHGDNTSLYVQVRKTTLVRNPSTADWTEHEVDQETASAIREAAKPMLAAATSDLKTVLVM